MGSFDQIKYVDEYNKQNYERIGINIPKEKYQLLKDCAKEHGLSVNRLIIEALETEYGLDLSR